MNAADLLLSTITGALVVVTGGLYALFLALGRLCASKGLARLALAAYLALAICAFVLADSLELSPAWHAVIAILLLGYWIAPRAIWHLTVATHAREVDS